jgi:hypothetical protein
MKWKMLYAPLVAVGVLTAGCSAMSTSSAPAPGSASAGTEAVSASPAAASTPACESADLRASLGGGAGQGMSQDHTGLQLRNVGSSACTLYGYPGVSWVAGADGHQVGAAAVRAPDASGAAEGTVTLAPGATASAPLDIVDAAAIPQASCKPVPVTGLRIYPPGERAALFIALATSSGGYGECSVATKQPTLIIGYVQPGVQPGGGGVG